MQELIDSLTSLGFTSEHLSLILLCGVSGALGSLVYVLLAYWGSMRRLPRKGPTLLPWATGLSRFFWILSRLLVGFVLGGFVALYLTDALAEGVTVVARVLVIAALLGYSLPERALEWLSQRLPSPKEPTDQP